MYQVERDDDGILSATFSETVTTEDVLAAVARANLLSAEAGSRGILLRFVQAKLPAPGALSDRIRYSEHIRPLVARTERVAVVTDQFWIRTLARTQAVLVSRVTTKDFAPDQEAAARAFLSGAV